MISITRFPPAIFSAMAEKSATSPTSAARIELLKARLWMGGDENNPSGHMWWWDRLGLLQWSLGWEKLHQLQKGRRALLRKRAGIREKDKTVFGQKKFQASLIENVFISKIHQMKSFWPATQAELRLSHFHLSLVLEKARKSLKMRCLTSIIYFVSYAIMRT